MIMLCIKFNLHLIVSCCLELSHIGIVPHWRDCVIWNSYSTLCSWPAKRLCSGYGILKLAVTSSSDLSIGVVFRQTYLNSAASCYNFANSSWNINTQPISKQQKQDGEIVLKNPEHNICFVYLCAHHLNLHFACVI